MQILDNDRTRMLSEQWNQQAGAHFDLAILALAVMNVIAACGTIALIFYDAHVLARLRSLSATPHTKTCVGKPRKVMKMHLAEILPLATSAAIALQGTVYITVQGIGLHALVMDCRVIAQFVWPGENPHPIDWQVDPMPCQRMELESTHEDVELISCSTVDRSLHNARFQSRDHFSFISRQAVPIPGEAKHLLILHRSRDCCNPRYLDPITHCPERRCLSGDSRLVDDALRKDWFSH